MRKRGRPPLDEGKIEAIHAENGFVVVRDTEYAKLGNPRIGAEFKLNGRRAVVVGVADVASSGPGVPKIRRPCIFIRTG